MSEIAEILQVVDRLHGVLADLVVRGVRSVGPAELAPLDALREECERINADHLAGRIRDLISSLKNADRSAAAALLRARTSLQLFERLLTLETTADLLVSWHTHEDTP